MLNRSCRAREGAGLSLGQGAQLLGVTADQLHNVEESDAAYATANPPRIADLYGVNIEWLSGYGELRDYASLEELRGADELPFRERDMLAELYASLPRRSVAR